MGCYPLFACTDWSELAADLAALGRIERPPVSLTVVADPFGANSVCQAHGYERPDWTLPSPAVRAGRIEVLGVDSSAFGERREVQPSIFPAQLLRPSWGRRERRRALRLPPRAATAAAASL